MSETRAPLRDPRRAYQVVDLFEQELCDYTGAPYAVTVDSCTNALFLSFVWERQRGVEEIALPRRTYIGVLQAALNADLRVAWRDLRWKYRYDIWPTSVVDSARHVSRGAYLPGTLTCLSLHIAKQIPVGRGGVILTDDPAFHAWAVRARQDGRTPGDDDAPPLFPAWHMYLTPDYAARGLWLLSRLPDRPADLPDEQYADLSRLPAGRGKAGLGAPRLGKPWQGQAWQGEALYGR